MKKAAWKQFPGAESVTHLLPNAYCVASDGLWAVFAVPPKDREPQLAGDPWITVRDSSVAVARTGEWYQLAYVVWGVAGAMRVIRD